MAFGRTLGCPLVASALPLARLALGCGSWALLPNRTCREESQSAQHLLRRQLLSGPFARSEGVMPSKLLLVVGIRRLVPSETSENRRSQRATAGLFRYVLILAVRRGTCVSGT